MPRLITSETHAGEALEWGGRTLVPFAHTFGLRLPLPGRWMGAQLTWTRPVSVLVRAADGQEQLLPVVNITRRVTWTMFGAAAALALAAGVFNVLSRRK
jgi:hypothetical protein